MTKSSRSCLARWAPREDPTAWGAKRQRSEPRSAEVLWKDGWTSLMILHIYVIHMTYVIHMWFICDSYVIHMWFICDSYVIHMWFICDSYVIHMWFICDSYVITRYSRMMRDKLVILWSTDCLQGEVGTRTLLPHPLIRGTVAPSVPAGYSCCILRQFGQLAYPVNPCLFIRFQTVKPICHMDFLLGVWVSNFKSHRNCKSRSQSSPPNYWVPKIWLTSTQLENLYPSLRSQQALFTILRSSQSLICWPVRWMTVGKAISVMVTITLVVPVTTVAITAGTITIHIVILTVVLIVITVIICYH